ncbi:MULTISPECIES: transglutaminase domain-containing protein [unclassified Thermoactinomyces]|uniref:transglutaminase domain-containing protein n=1 Tax=unclassified Thermoactinomyces TaxID=2634588 RepID=UPI0018DCE9B2|nr:MULTISPECIES: transglutaminase domain-containing protein [unclassified Thermoactinomyces]MBH8599222.1 transglutaminase domain-containing protein [Thermoactinomyces sp. CICC 10523]MBH8605576.1 transglutaminase domain-containing protein [Thermoactinomyces sp. CICC 10522]MBH8609009.1 transglutaminase domain-containing protein [Thermoactinomyces sp. CICC 10521]
MKSSEQRLDFCLQPVGEVSQAFQFLGVQTFQEASCYLQTLPYGRNADRVDARSVLREGKGTCSTKHALLAMLAEENNIPVRLMVGIYLMNKANTPDVGEVLKRYGFAVFGFHASDWSNGWDHLSFLAEKEITPEGIGEEKIRFHQDYLKHWVTSSGVPIKDWRKVWEIREACIAALTHNRNEPPPYHQARGRCSEQINLTTA